MNIPSPSVVFFLALLIFFLKTFMRYSANLLLSPSDPWNCASNTFSRSCNFSISFFFPSSLLWTSRILAYQHGIFISLKHLCYKKFRELWSPARQQIWPWSRSKVTVKVTTWYHRKGLVTGNTHAKYQSSICNSAKVMAKVKVFVTDGQTDRRTDEWDLMSPCFRESGGQKYR